MPRRDEQLDELVLEVLGDGAPRPRTALLRLAAEHYGVDPKRRDLRARVSTALRRLEERGLLVDGGPEVWLAPRSGGRGE